MDGIIVIKGVLCTGGRVSILQKSQLLKIYRFWCGYGYIKRDKQIALHQL